jgi:hypothetical protein
MLGDDEEMSNIMALDIETGNYSWEIGGWDKHALFEPTVVATWDGSDGHVFSKEDIDMVTAEVHELHPRTLGDHLQKHVAVSFLVTTSRSSTYQFLMRHWIVGQRVT